MNKEAFDAALAALQAQYDAAERAVAEAIEALNAAEFGAQDARKALRGHVTYGKHRGWIERAKRAPRPVAAEAAE